MGEPAELSTGRGPACASRPVPFRRLFVANRGEVAARIARTCDRLGVTPVFGVSEADRDAPWARDRERVVLGPARADQSYLDPVRLVQAAVQSGASALHPGWGFLSESPRLAALCEVHGVTFVGPPAHVLALLGRKTPARRAMAAAGLALVPGSEGVLPGVEAARAVADSVGYPVLLKADAGGGGRGMRVVHRPEDLPAAFAEASAEARAAFGDGSLYLERLITGGRHVEVQVLVDRWGHAVHLGERDCTVQRHHQKLVEESPCPVLDPAQRRRACEAAAAAAASVGYVGAGTVEMLLDEQGVLRFMEMNARLQVEHPVTEMRTGLDLVEWQLRIAAGQRIALRQDEIRFEGHAIECRINAEDPFDGFRPSPGRIARWRPPAEESGRLRVETHVVEGYEVPPHYDSLLCKLVAHDEDRDRAIARMLDALARFEVEGVRTTIALHRAILASEAFRANRYDTRTIPGWPPPVGEG